MAVIDQNEDQKDVEFACKKMAIVPTTLAAFESLTFPLVQEVVILADFQCKRCQDRVADILSRLNGEADSVEISLMEKKVKITLTRKHPIVAKIWESKLRPIENYKNSANKLTIVKRMFRSSSS
nr:putative heavy metal-associated domain, HMA [Tanacetum cinerariifolium]